MYPHVYIRGTGDGDRKDEGPKCRTHRHRVINTKRQLYCVVKTFYKINLRKPKPSKTGNKRHQNRRPQQSTIGGEKTVLVVTHLAPLPKQFRRPTAWEAAVKQVAWLSKQWHGSRRRLGRWHHGSYKQLSKRFHRRLCG